MPGDFKQLLKTFYVYAIKIGIRYTQVHTLDTKPIVYNKIDKKYYTCNYEIKLHVHQMQLMNIHHTT